MSSATQNDAASRRIIRSDGDRGILVIGSIPGNGEPTVTVRMNATEISGSMEACHSLRTALEEVVAEMVAIADGREEGGA